MACVHSAATVGHGFGNQGIEPMKISFDLDDTLICQGGTIPRETNRVPRLLRRWLPDPLRQGAVVLLQQLQSAGHEIVIYTTSHRSRFTVRCWLRCYGVRIEQVINQTTHQRAISRLSLPMVPTKMPPIFGIDLHIDDSAGVAIEAKRHDFNVLVVDPNDRQWTTHVLETVAKARAIPVGTSTTAAEARSHESEQTTKLQ